MSKHSVTAFLAIVLISIVGPSCALANEEISLMKLASSIVKSDSQLNEEREALFKLAFEEQQRLLRLSEIRLEAAEQKQESLKREFDNNEETIAELESKLNLRTGALGEVFGVAKESALELEPMIRDSLTSSQFSGRSKVLAFAESKRIPTIQDINSLQQLLSFEMKASGQVSAFESFVVDSLGQEVKQTVTRYGVFAATSEQGEYLAWDVPGQILKTLKTQPAHQVDSDAIADDSVTVLLDPTRGELFALLDRLPTLMQRIEQGGLVGYVIISLGLLGILIAVYQLIRLAVAEMGVRKQLGSNDGYELTNPLGRVLTSIEEFDTKAASDDNTVEMRVDEAILKELPKIEQGQSFLKLMAAVAPLLGLLGTVVGMILTFQSITLFGTSDPKLMANGISQALMTTVLGLVVAVPILFCHSLLVARAQRLVQILQEKSLGALISVGEGRSA
jgi:biopolymer transport protein ExbB